MIVRRPRTRLGNIPPPTPGIERVTTMKVLGAAYEENFSFREHVERMVYTPSSNHCLYAIRTLGAQELICTHLGMFPGLALWQETYASPSWWGLLDEGSRQRL